MVRTVGDADPRAKASRLAAALRRGLTAGGLGVALRRGLTAGGLAVAVGASWSGSAAAATPVPADRDADARVELRLVPAPGRVAPAGVPLTTGVPFADGALAVPDGLRVETLSGTPVPAGLEVRGRFHPSGHVRWLGVELAHVAGARGYRLVSSAAVAGPAKPAVAPIRVERRADAFVVTSGELRAEVPLRGAALGRVWLGERLVLERDAVGWLTRDSDGLRFAETGGAGPTARVERESPQHVVIRVDGRYAAPSAQAAPHWTLRLHFHAGLPGIRLQHTFVWEGSAESLQVRELGLGFRLASPARRALADRSFRPADGAVATPLGAGERLSLLQDRHRHNGRGESHFEVALRSPGGDRPLATGERAGGWVAAEGDGYGVSLVLQDLWRRHPSELRVEPDRIAALLWSSEGAARPLDLRVAALERGFGPLLLAQLDVGRYAERWADVRANPARLDPTGLARTHDLWLVFDAGGVANADRAALAESLDEPPLLLPDPAWTAASGAIGVIGAVDDERFPDREALVRRIFRDAAELVDDWGDYGFLRHGAGPHHAYDIEKGDAVARVWRYTGVDFGFTRAAWLGWLRSGERRYHELARPRTHFNGDVLRSHLDGPTRRLADWFFWGSGPTPLAWHSPKRRPRDPEPPPLGLRYGFGLNVEQLLFDWWLNGDARSLEVAEEVAAALRRLLAENRGAPVSWVPDTNSSKSRALYQNLEDLSVLGEQFDDAVLRGAALRLSRALLDPDALAGVIHERPGEGAPLQPYPSYLFYKGPNVLRHHRTLAGADRERVKRSLQRQIEYSLNTRSSEGRGAGTRAAPAFRWSGDARLLTYASERAHAWTQSILSAPQGRRGYTTKLRGVLAQGADVVQSQGALVAVLREAPDPLPLFPVLWKEPQRPAADALLWKSPGRPLRAEFVSRGARFEAPDGSPWPEAWTARTGRYVPEGSTRESWFASLQIPADAPAGVYRIRADWEGEFVLLRSDAERLVLEAPEGLVLGPAGSRPWYFEAGSGPLDVFATSRADVELRDPTGQVVELPKKAGRMRVARRPSAGLWQVRALRHAFFVATAEGAAFAYGDPARHALPLADRRPTVALPGERSPHEAQGGTAAAGLELRDGDTFALERPPISAARGSIEWWFTPAFDSGTLVDGEQRSLLALDGVSHSFELVYRYAITSRGDPAWELRVEGRDRISGERASSSVARGEALRWKPGGPVHLALEWDSSAEGRGFLVFVDGRPVGGSARRSARVVWPVPPDLLQLRIGPQGGRKRRPVEAVLRSLRISDRPRYAAALDRGESLRPEQDLAKDATTSLLCGFGTESPPCLDAAGRRRGAVFR